MDFEMHKRFNAITELQDFEIEHISARSYPGLKQTFKYLGVVQTIIWAGDQAYKAGSWLGRQ